MRVERRGSHGEQEDDQTGRAAKTEHSTYSSSKIAIIRDASGFVAICGIWRNSSRSIEPERLLEG